MSAIAGAVGLVVGFMNIPLSVLHGTPFTDFTVPAFIVVGAARWRSVRSRLDFQHSCSRLSALADALPGAAIQLGARIAPADT